MLFVKTKLLPSPIHGFGLFADEFIKKDALVCIFIDTFDRIIPLTRDNEKYWPTHLIQRYAYLSKGLWFSNLDNAKFMNHSDHPNLVSSFNDDHDRAARDIQVDEELTCNYYTFDEDAARKLAN